jgi:NTP pyrophosphatase (non-canonical NTP hydrolase)
MNNFEKLQEVHDSALNDLCRIINDWAEKKGWNEGEDSVMRKSSDIALMHSELSECLEFIRAKQKCVCGHSTTESGECVDPECTQNKKVSPPDDHVPSLTGEAAELADVLIRIFHYCGRRNINLGEAVRLKHEYNITRPYKHGKNL